MVILVKESSMTKIDESSMTKKFVLKPTGLRKNNDFKSTRMINNESNSVDSFHKFSVN